MHFPTFSVLLLPLTSLVAAAVNGPCTANGVPGVCVSTANCRKYPGAVSHPEPFCPNDPADIQCCTKSPCSGGSGTCMWESQCANGGMPDNLCPGPAGFKCCTAGGSPGGGIPSIPTRNCKQHVIDGGYIILRQFPGVVHTVWCYANKPGDHGTGTALDLMIKNRDPIGRTMAEWVMNNQARLRVKYVIWGQKIWDVQAGDKPKPWTSWKQMENRGDDTQNHWDHNHVSFLP
ncbi:hypothetical protein FPQ18DRAFT_376327 [Pyronema domesticum]|uniref:ARB-07466-like C-terminal domain-containing protein n=1 Tax=Pyronema omphalodes (strain CBS 100304) TaxID=1076935 RepID=U4LPR4_PYROM|nr:hypothetical protein FPQ18DRAFT_376327 [Pyronema domesticum]CCX33940.1 Similar to hypothetical protein TEQG_07413 [Trichophyton equinum CBS 127.97]; acc. no. EGE08431 [Pyronema omphalodes CBS 100304]